MTKENIVDDYYAQLQKKDNNQATKKLKIKAKPKKIIKKKVAEDIIEPKNERISHVPKIFKKVEKKGNKIIQKIQRIQVDAPKIEKPEQEKENKKVIPEVINKKKEIFKQDFKKDKKKGKKFLETTKNDPLKKKLKPQFSRKRFSKNQLLDDDDVVFERSNKLKSKKKEEKKIEDIKQNLIDRTGQTVIVPDILSLKEFSEKIGVPLPKLMGEFMKNGLMINLNSKVDFDTASIIAEAFEIKLEKDSSGGLSVEDILEGDISSLTREDDPEKLSTRPSVVSIMGHVDHGKTSLLDHIRKSKVADGEAGGITQSIGAYQVEQHGKKITFLDTPGHEAFTMMRARGAKSTDIAILVVAADEGVKPQTIESINHAREANIPIIVAINKMDKEGANPDHVKTQLSEKGLIPEDWGGDVIMTPVSAKTGQGIDDLLEMVLLVSEMGDFKANPDRNGVGTVIESHLDTKIGPVATVLINTGNFKHGDSVVCKGAYGRIRTLKDFASKNIKEALPSDPILIIGLDKVVEGGDIIQIVDNIEIARNKSNEYKEILRNKESLITSGLDMIMSQIKSGSLKQLKIVLKADTNGSLEAIKGALLKLSTIDVKVQIIHTGVGKVTEGDALMCQGSNAILIGFNVEPLITAKSIIESNKIEFINDNVIYHIIDRIEKIITGMLDPKEEEVILALAEVKAIFYDSKEFMIVGLSIGEGEIIEEKTKVRVIKDGKMSGRGEILSLKSGVEEVKKLEGPTECGIKFKGSTKLSEGDKLEVYKIEIKK